MKQISENNNFAFIIYLFTPFACSIIKYEGLQISLFYEEISAHISACSKIYYVFVTFITERNASKKKKKKEKHLKRKKKRIE